MTRQYENQQLSYRSHMSDSSQISASKQDIQLLMEMIGSMRQEMETWKDELKDHFDLAVENIRYDLTGANRDRIEDHELRIKTLELETGVKR